MRDKLLNVTYRGTQEEVFGKIYRYHKRGINFIESFAYLFVHCNIGINNYQINCWLYYKKLVT